MNQDATAAFPDLARRVDPVERIKRYIDEHAEEIRALEFGKIEFDIHHRRAKRGRIVRSDEFDEPLTA